MIPVVALLLFDNTSALPQWSKELGSVEVIHYRYEIRFGTGTISASGNSVRRQIREVPMATSGPSAKSFASGTPIGIEMRYGDMHRVFQQSAQVRTASGRYAVDLYAPHLSAPDMRAFLERFTRGFVAKSEGSKMTALEKVDGQSRWKSLDGAVYVDAQEWAANTGAQISFDRQLERLMIRAKGKEFLVPVASMKYRVGDAWHDLGGMLILRHDQVSVLG